VISGGSSTDQPEKTGEQEREDEWEKKRN
jgi:hypothetical protein